MQRKPNRFNLADPAEHIFFPQTDSTRVRA
jgi:hypothetical protein